MNNYELVMTSVLDSGLVMTLYRESKNGELYNLAMIGSDADVFCKIEGLSIDEALHTMNVQAKIDLVRS